mmetsp:Transcript_5888/g.14057  ORF Transcript_5888/g.14057 Transcript_5888/m.14057 type:complete len:1094 (+) Transcript_5888:47-3328(+)
MPLPPAEPEPGQAVSPTTVANPRHTKRFQDVCAQAQDCAAVLCTLLSEMAHQYELEATRPSGFGNLNLRADDLDTNPSSGRLADSTSTAPRSRQRGGSRLPYRTSQVWRRGSDASVGAPQTREAVSPTLAMEFDLDGVQPSSLQPQSSLSKAGTTDYLQDLIHGNGTLSSAGSELGEQDLIPLRIRKKDLKMQSGFDSHWDRKKVKAIPSEATTSRVVNPAMLSVSQKYYWTAINPDSIWMAYLELIGMACVMWDAFALPWYLALYVREEDPILWGSAWAPRMFWTLDVFINFGVGYRTSDLVLMTDLRSSAFHYLQRWFVFDAVVVLLDWWFAFILLHPPERGAMWLVYCTLLGVFVLRMMRQSWRFPAFHEKSRIMLRGRLSGLTTIFDIALILSALFATNHVIGCFWYMIGEHRRSDTGSTWLTDLQADSDTWRETTRRYLYATALHWALTQMTPGSMEVVPKSTGERVFTVVVLMLGLIVGPTLTASLTSMMTEKRLRIEEKAKRFMKLQQYLVQEDVDRRLVMSINRQVKDRLKERRRIQISDVEDLALVSKSMQTELHYAVYGKFLLEHLFFHLLDTFDKPAVLSICSHTITTIEQVKGDIVFECGQSGNSMFFVQSGYLQYYPRRLASEAADQTKIGVDEGTSCSEVALWAEWHHVGSLQAMSTSELLQLSAPALQRDLQKHAAAFALTCEFCRAFVKYYRSEASSWSDLSSEIDHDDIFSVMNRESRLLLCEPILEILRKKEDTFRFFSGMFESTMRVRRLREEISSGKCNISITTLGEVVRTVSLVVLRLRNAGDPNTFLVQIAERANSDCQVACKYPGTKRREQESASVALKRLQTEELSGLKHQSDMTDWAMEQSVTFMESKTFGIRTKYLRTTFESEVELTLPFRTVETNSRSFHVTDCGLVDKRAPKGRLPGRLQRWWNSCTGPAFHHISSSSSRSSRRGSRRGSMSSLRRPSDFHEAEAQVETDRSARRHVEESATQLLQEKAQAVLSNSKPGVTQVFLWLTATEFELLSQDACSRVLQCFVDQLDIEGPLTPSLAASEEGAMLPDITEVTDGQLGIHDCDQDGASSQDSVTLSTPYDI